MSYQFTQFFSLDSAKAIKARAFGYLNAINYMSPASTAGVGDMCPWSSVACRALCLGEHSGQAAMHKEGETNAVLREPQGQDHYVMRARAAFMRELHAGIAQAERKAKREGLALCVRLNGATDLNFVAVIKTYPHIQFVDYTKSPARMLAWCEGKLPSNYHLTFSFAGDNHDACDKVLAAGGSVAVCFSGAFPATWRGHDVVDGDLSDLRHLDPRGVVVALSPKGAKAKREGVKLGFVVQS